jgi:hypothetical protein
MSLINKATLDSRTNKNEPSPEEVAELAAEAASAKEREEAKNAEIKKRLNDKAFLNFLQKNPEAVDSSTDDKYLMEKIGVFDKIQTVKKEVTKFIVGESSSEFGSLVDDSFLEGIEDIAIKNPDEFLDFSSKVSKYLESAERNKTLIDSYREVAQTLGGIDVDINKMSAADKRKFVEDVHVAITNAEEGAEDELKKAKSLSGRKLLSYIPRTKTRAEWKQRTGVLNSNLDKLKKNELKLDREAVLAVIVEMEGIKDGLKGNQAFEMIRAEFKMKAVWRLTAAMARKNFSAITSDMETLEKTRNSNSFLTESDFDEIQADIHKYSKEALASDTQGMVESKEAVTLNVFEKGIDSMRKKGLSLGLSKEECDEQIIVVLRDKIAELNTKQNEGQNRIKLILAKRVLNNIE